MTFALREVVGYIVTAMLATGGVVGSYFAGIKGAEGKADTMRTEMSGLVQTERTERSAITLDHEKRISATEAKIERIPMIENKLDELLRANGINPKAVSGELPVKAETSAPLVKKAGEDGAPQNEDGN